MRLNKHPRTLDPKTYIDAATASLPQPNRFRNKDHIDEKLSWSDA